MKSNKQTKSNTQAVTAKPEHTPTPWHMEENTLYGADMFVVNQFDREEFPIDEVNAAFIVRAVNVHDNLLRAVKEYRAQLTGAVGRSLDLLITKAEGNNVEGRV